ncbi:MAG: hypothetical protein KJ672_05235 [Candidatus Thermoplasmatota archaeon]|nr:hypothetical protein [Candidatus Thermoplasmatota archaeon]
MVTRPETPAAKTKTEIESEVKEVDKFGSEMYAESAVALREVGAKVLLAVVTAIVVWLFGQLVFVPIAESMTEEFAGYPVHKIVSFIIVVALALIVFTVFVYIRRLSTAVAGIVVYHFGKAGGETRVQSYKNYAKVFDGLLYVVVVSLAYLLFAAFLADIHPAIPAVLLILIVLWSIFTLWRSFGMIGEEIGRYTSKVAEELEKRSKNV